MTIQYRQGDVLLVRVAELPADAVPEGHKDRIILAHGELTGHAHAVSAAAARMYLSAGERLLSVRTETQLVHEEHAPIRLEPGVYRVIRQREYVPGMFARDVED